MKKQKGVLSEVTKEDIKLLKENPVEFWADVKEIGEFAFTNSGVTSLVIPKGVEKLSVRAFHSCKHLEEVALPESMTEVNKCAFQWCWSLTNVLLPQTITQIKDFAFMGCEKMTKIYIPDSVEVIGKGAFAHCHNLEKVTLPENVKTIGEKVFYACGKLKEVYSMGPVKFDNKIIEGMSVGAKLYVRQFEDEVAAE